MRLTRIDFVFLLFLIIGLVLIGRLYYLQIYKGKEYKHLSEKNYLRILTINPPRGKIYDRNGILLAYDVPYYELYVLPYMLNKKKDLPELEKNLKKYLSINLTDKQKERILKGFSNKVVLHSKLTEEQIKNFYDNAFHFKGVFIEVVPRRKYTKYAKYLPHILGYVSYPSKEDFMENPNIKPDMLIGKMGVEKIYNDYLTGEYGLKAIIVDASGRIKKTLWEKPSKEGKDIYLTIDARMQKIAYEAFKKSKEKSGAIVIADPNTYEIHTLLSYPIFDIQKFSDGLTEKEWNNLIKNKYKPLFNKVLNGLYPPGSIYKIIVSIAAMEEKIITPYTKIYSGGIFEIGKWKYRNWNLSGCGNINVMQALEQSCDTFFYQVGLKLGVAKIDEYTYMFGLGEKLNPDIETKISRIPSPDWKRRHLGEPWFHGDTVNLSIGQGYLGITPFDALKIVIPVVNGGKVLKPNILKSYHDKKTGNIVNIKPEILRVLNINKLHRLAVKKGMYLVVYGRKGTAKILKQAPVINAGKTGTAQVYRKPKKGEKITKWELQNHAWFVDFFPYKKPKFVIATFVEHGKGGSIAAAPITKNIIKNLYLYKIVQ